MQAHTDLPSGARNLIGFDVKSVHEIALRCTVTPQWLLLCYAVTMGIVHSGPRNPNWRGGRSIASTGYVLIRVPGHPLADTRGYVYEHRLVASEMLGRMLLRSEIVHHLNGDKTDNRSENLCVAASRHEHRLMHGEPVLDTRTGGGPNPSILCACGCKTRIKRYDKWGRPRRFVTGHNTASR
jgi:hypothetical protein